MYSSLCMRAPQASPSDTRALRCATPSTTPSRGSQQADYDVPVPSRRHPFAPASLDPLCCPQSALPTFHLDAVPPPSSQLDTRDRRWPCLGLGPENTFPRHLAAPAGPDPSSLSTSPPSLFCLAAAPRRDSGLLPPPADTSPPPHPDTATCRIPSLRPHLSPYRRRPPSSRGIASIGNSSRVKRDGHSAQQERHASGWIGLGPRSYDTPVPLRPTPGRPAIRAYAGTLALLASTRTTPDDLFTTTTSTPKGPRREDQEVRRTRDAWPSRTPRYVVAPIQQGAGPRVDALRLGKRLAGQLLDGVVWRRCAPRPPFSAPSRYWRSATTPAGTHMRTPQPRRQGTDADEAFFRVTQRILFLLRVPPFSPGARLRSRCNIYLFGLFIRQLGTPRPPRTDAHKARLSLPSPSFASPTPARPLSYVAVVFIRLFIRRVETIYSPTRHPTPTPHRRPQGTDFTLCDTPVHSPPSPRPLLPARRSFPATVSYLFGYLFVEDPELLARRVKTIYFAGSAPHAHTAPTPTRHRFYSLRYAGPLSSFSASPPSRPALVPRHGIIFIRLFNRGGSGITCSSRQDYLFRRLGTPRPHRTDAHKAPILLSAIRRSALLLLRVPSFPPGARPTSQYHIYSVIYLWRIRNYLFVALWPSLFRQLGTPTPTTHPTPTRHACTSSAASPARRSFFLPRSYHASYIQGRVIYSFAVDRATLTPTPTRHRRPPAPPPPHHALKGVETSVCCATPLSDRLHFAGLAELLDIRRWRSTWTRNRLDALFYMTVFVFVVVFRCID
ncbi:hypothetical protein C8R43DRAFT_1233266 [Mycena crocata]|nr:hypothetical protein C8R43DRAFT_1233266 [Mycena crocata]